MEKINRIKIGQFIAECRKNKKITQEQLAEKLDVSKNAVSKWERGICLMDMSLLKPLSLILEVTVNEILAGEKIKDEELKNRADENIVNITELYDLKSSKSGVAAFTGISALLLIYCSRKGIDTLPIIIIWFVYNLGYFLNQYRLTKDKKKIMIAMLYGVGLVVTTVLFVVKTF